MYQCVCVSVYCLFVYVCMYTLYVNACTEGNGIELNCFTYIQGNSHLAEAHRVSRLVCKLRMFDALIGPECNGSIT